MYWDNQFERGQFPANHEEYHNTQTHSQHNSLQDAKKVCRQLGHKNDPDSYSKGFSPIAFVAQRNEEKPADHHLAWLLVYNPRFKKG